MMASVAGKGLSLAENMASQRVIGYSRTVTKTKGKKNPKVIQENLNVAVQVWEIGVILAGIAVYEYVNGSGSLFNNATQVMGGYSQNGIPIITLPAGGM